MSIENDDVESNEVSVTSSPKRCKTTYLVWEYYEPLPLNNNPNNRLRAKCKECGHVYLADSTAGATNLLHHHVKHKNISRQVVLDRRYKLKLVKFCFLKFDHLNCDEKVKVIEDNLARLFKEYMKYSDIEVVASSSHECDIEILDEMEEFNMFESPHDYSSEKIQFNLYLKEPILMWTKLSLNISIKASDDLSKEGSTNMLGGRRIYQLLGRKLQSQRHDLPNHPFDASNVNDLDTFGKIFSGLRKHRLDETRLARIAMDSHSSRENVKWKT
ncbi:hypothetical protein HAX54_047701 [Datura stramonium]|uniref:BED-type domain-containing protein n=1 Tax=Datura stramonium TaxID=4076 RepID=A0ABS8SUA5_DATST|nr:hypothetical protein [Datura stramonium]